MRIGILDGQAIQSTIFCRELFFQGYEVILFADNKLSYGYGSKYAHSRLISPSIKDTPDKFHDFLIEYLASNHIDVLIPMNDYSAEYLSKNKVNLQSKVNFLIPEYNIFMKGYDKMKLMELCKVNEIPHPQTLSLTIDALEINLLEKFKYPAIIKPNITTGARGFKIVNSPSETIFYGKKIIQEYGACHLQEYISNSNKQFKVQIFRYKGKSLLKSVMEKERFYPIKGGSSCFSKTIQSELLFNQCYKVLEKLNWEGFADFDLLYDSKEGIYKIIEINPRVPASIKLPIVAGIPYPEFIVKASLNYPLPKVVVTNEETYYLRYLAMDILGLFERGFSKKTISNFLQHFKSKNHYFQDLDLKNVRSFIYGSIGAIKKQMSKTFRNQKNYS